MFSTNYLNKRSISFKSFQFPNINKKKYFSSILIIPSYKESNYIIETLNSLNNQNEFNLSELLVIIVVNNSISDPESVIKDNVKTINLIRKFNSNYSLEYIDASTKGNALPSNLAGVGYSRKIGMDFSLKYSKEDTILHCLDADTIVSPDYFQTIGAIYKKKKINALITNFEHQLPIKNKQLSKFIKEYESFLKNTAKSIRQSGSPYGYVSLGPTITCSAKTYVKVGGMVPKKATEDFYFLQKIRKFTEIYFLKEKLVFPSSRLSDRVYLGTGFRMNEMIEGKLIKDLCYSKKSFKVLSKSIKKILSLYKQDMSTLKSELVKIESCLGDFFNKQGLFDIWYKLNNQSKNYNQFELQFHKWFDNLKTLRLLKFYS